MDKIKEKSRTWAEISLKNLIDNIDWIRSRVQNNAMVIWVVKADAYGHGAVEVSRLLVKKGAKYLAVATIEEAIEIRKSGIDIPILVLSASCRGYADDIIDNNITVPVYTKEDAEYLSDKAMERNTVIKVHIAVDTGMGRIGFNARNTENIESSSAQIKALANLKGICIEGMFTHFATADEESTKYTEKQFSLFSSLAETIKQDERIASTIKYVHCANSAAIIAQPEMHLDAVRAGIILYGLNPSDYIKDKYNPELKPLMTVKSKITYVKYVESDMPVSYGSTYVVAPGSYIATVPIGYADGYRRLLSNKAVMYIKGYKVPVVGRVCMDQAMVDVTELFKNGIEVVPGDTIQVFGEENVTADDVAALSGTINYDITCGISPRVPRIYIEE